MQSIAKEKELYLLFLPVLLYYIIFKYIPLSGIFIAFEKYSPRGGVFGSEFVGLANIMKFINSYNFKTLMFNTFRISFFTILFDFPMPILFAVMLNEIRSHKLKKITQTISYLPHFISLVVVVGMIVDFTRSDGLINDLVAMFGGERVSYLIEEEWFTPIYVMSEIWKNFGWNSIIYIAALAGISQELYEAADIDGAGRLGKILHVTLPGLLPTVTIMLIMRIGKIMTVGYEKIILLENDLTLNKAEVISSYVYKIGFGTAPDYGYSTAINLFNSVINLAILFIANSFSRKLTESSLW